MPLFRAELYTPEGARRTVRREAASENDLLRELAAERCTVVSVKEEKPRAWSLGGKSRRKKLSLEEQHLFCATLSSFMRSGLSLTEVLKLLQKQTRGKNLKPIYTELRESVEGGRSLAASMAALGVFRPGLVGMVESGEKSASLGEILEKAGELIQNEISLRRKIQTALTYPVLMLFVGMGVVIFLLSFVVPRLTALVIESGAQLPLITRMLIFVSDAVRAGIIPFAAAVALLALYMRRKHKKISLPLFREARENLYLRAHLQPDRHAPARRHPARPGAQTHRTAGPRQGPPLNSRGLHKRRLPLLAGARKRRLLPRRNNHGNPSRRSRRHPRRNLRTPRRGLLGIRPDLHAEMGLARRTADNPGHGPASRLRSSRRPPADIRSVEFGGEVGRYIFARCSNMLNYNYYFMV